MPLYAQFSRANYTTNLSVFANLSHRIIRGRSAKSSENFWQKQLTRRSSIPILVANIFTPMEKPAAPYFAWGWHCERVSERIYRHDCHFCDCDCKRWRRFLARTQG